MAVLPLKGIRVLELALNVAVPMGARFLAGMGAEVIKVETSKHVDPVRTVHFAENTASGAFWNKGGYGHEQNTGKLGLSLDLGTRDGQELFKQLVRLSDVVAENFTPRVTENWGLTWDTIRKINPSIIMLSCTGYGRGGPWENYKAYGMSLEGTTGVSAATGYPGGRPMRTGLAYPDTPTGYMVGFALLAALEHRQRTGEGQWIEFSMYEVGISLMSEAILDFTMNQRELPRNGNQRRDMVPHGAYRCRGKDAWVAIAVATDEEWHSLCRVIGNTALADDPRFKKNAGRLEHRQEVDQAIEQWTLQQDRDAVALMLQQAGVAAGGVLASRDVLLDPHLRERQFFERVTYTGEMQELGTRVLPGRPWRVVGEDAPPRKPAPALGEDTGMILGDLLGLPASRVAELARKDVTTRAPKGIPPPRNLTAKEMLAQGAIVDYDPDFKEKLGLV